MHRIASVNAQFCDDAGAGFKRVGRELVETQIAPVIGMSVATKKQERDAR